MVSLSPMMRRLGTPALLILVFLACLSQVALAHRVEADSPRVSWSLSINGRDVRSITPSHPLRLSPTGTADMRLRVRNTSSTATTVRYLRFTGGTLSLTFFSYDTRIDMVLSPGGSDERAFQLDLLDLKGQATGLLPARVSLLEPGGRTISTASLDVDVRGSLDSVYGTFGLAVAFATLLLLGAALWATFRGSLHPNRWRRAMTWAGPGIGIGFVLSFTMSALRLMVPSPGVWTVMIVLGAVLGFTAGYLTPTPGQYLDVDPVSEDNSGPPMLAGWGDSEESHRGVGLLRRHRRSTGEAES